MNPTQARKPSSQGLILTRRQLNAALRKSAQRAQRLADAFGKTVPTVEPDTPKATIKRSRPPKANGANGANAV